MKQFLENLKTFVSSPNDVYQERQELKEIILEINETIKDPLGVYIDPILWENYQSFMPKGKSIQDVFNEKIEDCKFFVLILGEWYGSKEDGNEKGNTERELDKAIEIFRKNKKITILAYLKKIKQTKDKGPQLLKVLELRDRIKKEGILYKEFNELEEFKIKVTHDLYKTILNYKFSTSKNSALKKFWKFGAPRKDGLPLLGIIYPAMGKNYMGDQEKNKIWLNRLEPNIVFEDFKALQKIQKCLRLSGYANYRIFNSQNIPNELSFYNRFWICLPRNNDGRMHLDKYKQYARFKISCSQSRQKAHFLWKNKTSENKYLKIHSPLSNYLSYQRSSLNIDGEWHSQLDNIIAKDYAILARFRERTINEDDNLFDYFLAGIRGLGTWGAAWFIDREYSWFTNNDIYDDMQVLLEIEYKKGEIVKVKDVSEEPQSYFNEENKASAIKKRIKQFNPAIRL